MYSFQGQIDKAISVADYQWLMFYPCVYLFAMWDGYRDALILSNQNVSSYQFLPFVLSAYLSTIGLIYSDLGIFHITFGPVFQPLISIAIGLTIGFLIQRWLIQKEHST